MRHCLVSRGRYVMQGNLKGLGGWVKNSFIDYPGTVSTVLFFSGCNLRCPYCHNCSLLDKPPDISGRSDEFWKFLEKRKGLVDGVVISGGEPTLHPYLKEYIRELQQMGFKVKLDTNGLLPEVIEAFACDYVALDIKTEPGNYPALLKSPYNDEQTRLKKSIAIVKGMEKNAEIRITVANRIVTRQTICNLIPLLEGAQNVFLQPADLKLEILEPAFFESLDRVSAEEMEEYRTLLSSVVGTCVVRNE